MSSFEYLGRFPVGQYMPTDSVLHRLHPGVKLAASVLVIGATVGCRSLAALLVTLAALALLIRVGRLPATYALAGIRSSLPLLSLVALLQVLAIPANDTGRVLLEPGGLLVTTGDLVAAGAMVLRFASLIVLITTGSQTISTRELAHGTEALLRPFARLGFPAHELALTVTVTLHFLPILALEAEHIAKAQASRGADFGRGRMGILRRVRRMLPLFVPLFHGALRRAETLVSAMEARCYAGGRGRTALVRYPVRPADVVATAAAGLAAAAMLAAGSLRLDWRLWAAIVG